jgi:hypothetical protein
MGNNKPNVMSKPVVYIFFLLGLLSAIAFRAIIIFQHLEPSWVRPVWYAGTSGYLLFFLYRYRITWKRKKAVEKFQLIEKIRANACLQDEDREVLLYLLSSIKLSPEGVNYAIIFALSVLAVLADLVLTAMK